MKNAGPRSTHSDHESKPHSPQSVVVISEENLAALLRATKDSTSSDAPRQTEDAEASRPVSDRLDTSAVAPPTMPDPSAGPSPIPAVGAMEHLPLFATLQQHCSVILSPSAPSFEQFSAGVKDTTTMPCAIENNNLSVSIPPEVDPLQITTTTSNLLNQAPRALSLTSSWTGLCGDRIRDTARARFITTCVIGVVIAAAGIFTSLTRVHGSQALRVPHLNFVDHSDAILKESTPTRSSFEITFEKQTGTRTQTSGEQNPAVKSQNSPNDEAIVVSHYPARPKIQPFALPVAQRIIEPRSSMNAPRTLEHRPANLQQPVAQPSATWKAQNDSSNSVNEVAQYTSPLKLQAFAPPATRRANEMRTILDVPPVLPDVIFQTPAMSLEAPTTAILPPPPFSNLAAQQKVRVESKVQMAKLMNRVIPIYPPLAKAGHVEGTVRFTALISKDGRIENLSALSGTPLLVDAARAAVKQWVYRPTLLNGVPVEVLTQVDFTFTMNSKLR